MSVGKRNLNNKSCWATNSFGSWSPTWPIGFTDNDDTNNLGKTNNIKTGNHIHVDRSEDWRNSIFDNNDYRYRDLSISKKKYDEIKYMNGYYGWYKDFWSGQVTSYQLESRNCTKFASELWFVYTNEWLNGDMFPDSYWDHYTPGVLYNSIGGCNWDNQSQCYTNSLQY